MKKSHDNICTIIKIKAHGFTSFKEKFLNLIKKMENLKLIF